MANDIFVESSEQIDGRVYVQLLVIYASTFKTSDGLTKIVPTPSATLSELAQAKLPTEMLQKLDDGEAFAHPLLMHAPARMPTAQLKRRIRQLVRGDRAAVVAKMTQRYRLTGELLDSTES